MSNADDADLVDYEEEDEVPQKQAKGGAKGAGAGAKGAAGAGGGDVKKGSYAGIHSSGFRDFLLKPEILHAVADAGFEHPSEVQQECIPQAILGMDVISQAKSGMGKTAVFVLATLQQLPDEAPAAAAAEGGAAGGSVDTLVLCHTRELAYQICQEYERFSKYLPEVKVRVVYGGVQQALHESMLEKDRPQIVVGTPGRVLALIRAKKLKLDGLKRFVLDECDQLLESLDMRRDIQAIFRSTPREKQTLLFSATLSKEIRPVCRKFTQHPIELYIDDESKLSLHGLQQYFVKLTEAEKNRRLNDLLDALDFNQIVIFVNGVRRCKELDKLLTECNFPSMAIYGGLSQPERIERYNKFKDYKARILVSTDIFGRGVDFERVNIVINYDMPTSGDQYLHRVGRSGRFGTKGLSISFVSSEDDSKILEEVQGRFEVKIEPLPDQIDTSSFMS